MKVDSYFASAEQGGGEQERRGPVPVQVPNNAHHVSAAYDDTGGGGTCY